MGDLRSLTELALDLIKEHLRPRVEDSLKDDIQTPNGIKPCLVKINEIQETQKREKRYDYDFDKWRPEDYLEILSEYPRYFDRMFKNRIGSSSQSRFERSWQGFASTLVDLRHQWAHRDRYTDNDAIDFSGEAARLLASCGATGAASILIEKRVNLGIPSPTTSWVGGGDTGTTLLEINRIKRSSEPDFAKFIDLIKKAYPDPSLRDPDEDLERWLDQSSQYMAQQTKVDDTYMIAKHKHSRVAVAYLFVSHFPTLDYMFINSIAHDKELASEMRSRGDLRFADEISYSAIRMLLENLLETTQWDKGIVIEAAQNDRDAEMKRLFRGYGRELFSTKLYALDMKYVRPTLNPEKLDDTRELELLYMPGTAHRKIIGDGSSLPKDTVMNILDFVYKYVYGGNFKTVQAGDRYQDHIAKIATSVYRDLTDPVPLKDLAPW